MVDNVNLIFRKKGYTDIICISPPSEDRISSVYKVNKPGVGHWIVKRIKKEYAILHRAEKSILTTYRHDFLPTVFDVFEDESALYIAMEFIFGKSFQDLIDSKKAITETAARKYFLQLCDLFEYLHSKDVVHRDCKPSNIILSDNDNVYLIDFGISKTQEYNPKGKSKKYASPEQLEKSDIEDTRTDVYSLGATIYSLLTNGADDHRSGLKDRKDISKKLKAIIAKCMAHNPKDRYQSMAEIKVQLQKRDWIWKASIATFFVMLSTVVVFFGFNLWVNELTDRLLIRGDELKVASNYQFALSNYETYIRRRPWDPCGYERRRNLFIHRAQFAESLLLFNETEEDLFDYFFNHETKPEFRATWENAVRETIQHYYNNEMWDALYHLLENPRVQRVEIGGAN